MNTTENHQRNRMHEIHLAVEIYCVRG